MINLDIDPYCQNCPEFKPKVTKENLFSKGAEEYEGTETFITCKHEKRCRSMMNYLRGKYDYILKRNSSDFDKHSWNPGEVTVEDCSNGS